MYEWAQQHVRGAASRPSSSLHTVMMHIVAAEYAHHTGNVQYMSTSMHCVIWMLRANNNMLRDAKQCLDTESYIQGFDRHQTTHRSTLRVAANSMPDSLFLPILQSLQTTALADAMSSLRAPTALYMAKQSILGRLAGSTSLAHAQLLADERARIEACSTHIKWSVPAVHEQYDKQSMQTDCEA